MEAIRIMISNPRPALVVLVAVPCLTTIIWWTISYLAFPLRKYPGPFRADWTNWWRFFLVRSGSYHLAIKKLHDNRGPVVRIGPNTLDIDYPELSKTFYGTDGKWKKTEFYQNNSAIVNG
ncbi:cytochrome P450 [Apiospora saccharicola]|uniref:Cytochrome P450 n=1 Tax=Apiospora saccharicola TaxID=335842 RepID=A0ABR1U2A7_9PEZI